jgi:hypothetical protein
MNKPMILKSTQLHTEHSRHEKEQHKEMWDAPQPQKAKEEKASLQHYPPQSQPTKTQVQRE